MTLPYTLTGNDDPGKDEARLRAERMAGPPIAGAGLPLDPPDQCPECNATLKDIGPVGVGCPHCGANLEAHMTEKSHDSE